MINDLKRELSKLKYQKEVLNDLFDYLLKNENINKSIPNSRVVISFDDGTFKEGRALKYNSNKNAWEVKLDESEGIIKIQHDKIKIKYPGPDGLIDKLIWLNECKQNEINKIIQGSQLPREIIDKKFVNIKVVEIYQSNEDYCFIDFEVFGISKALRTKVPLNYAKKGKYLQLNIQDGDINDIHFVSKEKYCDQE